MAIEWWYLMETIAGSVNYDWSFFIEKIGGINMKFGKAIKLMKQGYKLKRVGWNGKSQYVFYINGVDIKTLLSNGIDSYYQIGEWQRDIFLNLLGDNNFIISDLLAIKTTSNQVQLGWLASQTDMLSSDWEVVEDE